jgi:hypothetical protein
MLLPKAILESEWGAIREIIAIKRERWRTKRAEKGKRAAARRASLSRAIVSGAGQSTSLSSNSSLASIQAKENPADQIVHRRDVHECWHRPDWRAPQPASLEAARRERVEGESSTPAPTAACLAPWSR